MVNHAYDEFPARLLGHQLRSARAYEACASSSDSALEFCQGGVECADHRRIAFSHQATT
jgi:hypothetical protein